MRHVCARRWIIGVHRGGGFAERVAVPGSALWAMPSWLSFQAAAMVEPAANAVHAWNRAGAPAGARVAVIGCGAIGLLCMLAALAGGAGGVDVSGLSPRPGSGRRALGGAAGDPSGGYDVLSDAVVTPAT